MVQQRWDQTGIEMVINKYNVLLMCVLPEEFLHEAVKALNPAVLGWLDRLGSVRNEGEH